MPAIPMFRDAKLRNKVIVMFAALIAGNVIAWAAAFVENGHYARFAAMAWLAYGFGLRHAVDADHICAIDNTTRKLMQDGKRPVGVGLYFSLGHSTVVVLLCVLASFAASYATHHIRHWQEIGGEVGTVISSSFLYVIALINIVVLWSLFKAARDANSGEDERHLRMDELLQKQGILGRLFRPILRTITSSWQMYFVGFLFGLGFDTATEIGVISLSAQQSGAGLPFWALLLLPAMFTLGMSLIDAANGVMMLGAYGWAFIKPSRKLVYNFSIVIVSVAVALFIATKQLYEMSGAELWKGKIGEKLNSNLGFAIVGVFVLGWLMSVAIYKLRAGQDTLLPRAEPNA